MTLPVLLLLAALQGSDRITCNTQVQWIVKADQPIEMSRSATTQLAFFSSLGAGCGSADGRDARQGPRDDQGARPAIL